MGWPTHRSLRKLILFLYSSPEAPSSSFPSKWSCCNCDREWWALLNLLDADVVVLGVHVDRTEGGERASAKSQFLEAKTTANKTQRAGVCVLVRVRFFIFEFVNVEIEAIQIFWKSKQWGPTARAILDEKQCGARWFLPTDRFWFNGYCKPKREEWRENEKPNGVRTEKKMTTRWWETQKWESAERQGFMSDGADWSWQHFGWFRFQVWILWNQVNQEPPRNRNFGSSFGFPAGLLETELARPNSTRKNFSTRFSPPSQIVEATYNSFSSELLARNAAIWFDGSSFPSEFQSR